MTTTQKAILFLCAALVLPACDDDDDSGGGSDGGDASPAPAATALSASLSGTQQVPPVSSFARGPADFFVPSDGQSVRFMLGPVAASGATGARVNLGRPGNNGPVLFVLSPTSFTGPIEGTLTAADLQPGSSLSFAQAVDALRRGDAHVVVTTVSVPDGEIRGQIGPARFATTLNGARVAPPVTTTGTGNAAFVLNPEQDRLDFTLETGFLSGGAPTGAQLRFGSPGLNGPTLFVLSPSPFSNPLSGSLTEANLIRQPTVGIVSFADVSNALLSGNVYVVVTSSANPAGEIRGQLGVSTLRTDLSGSSVPGIVASPGTGTGAIVIDQETGLVLNLNSSNLTGTPTSAQIMVPAGPVLFNLTPTTSAFDPGQTTFTMTPFQPQPALGINTVEDATTMLMAGNAVVTVPTTTFPNGEIQGQVMPNPSLSNFGASPVNPGSSNFGAGPPAPAFPATGTGAP